jgi:hypothetical protein
LKRNCWYRSISELRARPRLPSWWQRRWSILRLITPQPLPLLRLRTDLSCVMLASEIN